MFAPISRFEAQTPVSPALPRSFGAIDLEFHLRDGVTHAHRVYQQGVMRARFPNVPRGQPPEAVLINTAGGLTGGDFVTMGVQMNAGAHALVTTQAHEKVYRAMQGEVSVTTQLRVQAGAMLEWLPQPTILFDGARLCRQTAVELAEDSIFLGVEAVIFGRAAMQETMTSGLLSDHWTITRNGRLVHADRFAVEDDIAAELAKPSVLQGQGAMATIRYVAPDAASRLAPMREWLQNAGAASAWNGLLLARVVAPDGYRLGIALARILTGLRGRPLPPIWSI
jgi:urease accessory protein